MATFTIYHDTRRLRKDGLAPLKLAVRYGKNTIMVSLDIHLAPGQWDAKTNKVINHPKKKTLTQTVQMAISNARYTLRVLAEKHGTPSPKQVRSYLVSGKMPDQETFISFFRQVAEDVRCKERTHEIYRATIRKLELYAQYLGMDAENWFFEDITRAWVADFDLWLQNTSPSKNARNIHLRNIRHVCNRAVDEHITDFYDFRGVSIKPVPTVKRSLSVENLRMFFDLEVEKHQRKYLDYFKLIFYLIGINTIDLCHLKKKDLRDGRIEYRRSKTDRLYSILVEPEAKEIIDRYAGQGEWLMDVLDRYSNFKDFAHRLNENLQKMGTVEIGKHGKKTRIPMFPDITTYWARHSWATIASSLDIPNETIAAALGHGYGNKITAIYIDFDMKKVDVANRRVIDWVLYGKK